jgi:hypothetical protein
MTRGGHVGRIIGPAEGSFRRPAIIRQFAPSPTTHDLQATATPTTIAPGPRGAKTTIKIHNAVNRRVACPSGGVTALLLFLRLSYGLYKSCTTPQNHYFTTLPGKKAVTPVTEVTSSWVQWDSALPVCGNSPPWSSNIPRWHDRPRWIFIASPRFCPNCSSPGLVSNYHAQ